MKLSKKIGLISLSLVLSFATSASAAEKFYYLKRTSFSKYVWVNDGQFFTNINTACIEIENTANMYIQYWDKNDNFVSSQLISGSGWKCDNNPRYGTYRIKLLNANRNSEEKVRLVGGEIWYDK